MPKQLRYLLFAYRFGLPAGVLIAFSGSPYAAIFAKVLPDISNSLLAFSLCHMMILVLLGVQVPKPSNELAGSKIKTAGYLYTLIGFLAAMWGIKPGVSTLASFMIPLGSAFVTSVIGWFAGGEIGQKDSIAAETSIRFEREKVLAELAGFSAGVRRVHEDYIKAISAMIAGYRDLHQKQARVAKQATEMARKLTDIAPPIFAELSKWGDCVAKAGREIDKRFGDAFMATLSQIGTNAKRAATELDNTANAAQDVAKYLEQNRVLIEELKRLMDFLASENGRHED